MRSAAEPRRVAHRACGACGVSAAKVCHHQCFRVPDGYPLPAEYDMVVCQGCGFVYADPHATQRDYDRFYCEWSKYDDTTTATGSGLSEHDAARLATTAQDIARVLPSRAATILDAGCATGGLLSALRTAGFTAVAGLDPSPRCAAACRERGFQAYIGSIAEAPADMPKFDCVVLSHVLEHVYDIPAFFDAARSLLSPGGYLYIETPNAARYADYLYAPFQEFNTEHINHFSTRGLANTAQRYGFPAVTVETKVFPTGKDTDYPAVFGIFRDSGTANSGCPAVRDAELPARIETYIRLSARQMESIDRHLATELRGQRRILLWGAGQLAMKLLALPCLRSVEIGALVDNNPILRGKRFGSAPVVGPQEIVGGHDPIIIATLLHAGEIISQIRRMGLHNPVIELLPGARAEAHSS